jgi:hypothetical protein
MKVASGGAKNEHAFGFTVGYHGPSYESPKSTPANRAICMPFYGVLNGADAICSFAGTSHSCERMLPYFSLAQ